MSNPLFPCPSCARHVRAGADACPFCRAALPAEPAAVVPAAAGTLTRAAIFAFASTVAACSTQQSTPSTPTVQPVAPAPQNDPGVAAIYGGPPPVPMTPDAAAPAPTPDVTAPAEDAVVAEAAVPDASATPDATRPTPRPRRDGGAPMVRYGAPPASFV